METQLSALLKSIAALAHQAGAGILEIYNTEFSVESKDDQSPLTAADMRSHHTIIEGLTTLTPTTPILSEESSDIPFSVRSHWREYWLVDPLDGTKEFIKRNGEFTVNIALVRDHRAILGVVHVPVLEKTYLGNLDNGAHVQARNEEPFPIRVRPVGDGPIRVVGSRSHQSKALNEYLKGLGPHELVSMGSSLKFCLIAEGKADIYPRLGPTSEWDTAAAQAIVESAGGYVTDVNGRPLRYNTKEDILNPHFLVFGDSDRDWTRYVPSRHANGAGI